LVAGRATQDPPSGMNPSYRPHPPKGTCSSRLFVEKNSHLHVAFFSRGSRLIRL
jgi:hypothetical protein